MSAGMDESARRLLELVRNSGRRPYEELAPAEAREQQRLGAAGSQIDPPEIAGVVECAAPSSSGPIPLRLYRGLGSATPARALIYLHGGGWALGSIATHDPLCRSLANAAACTVISVEYRLAPEHRFPAAVEDSIAATEWILREAAALGIDPARIAIGGDSAGANLAVVAALALNEAREKAIAGQVLIYPALDMRMGSASHRSFTTDLLLTHQTMLWFRGLYLGDAGEQFDWRASPCLSQNLKLLPPTFMITAGYDPLCDEAHDFAATLRSQGIAVRHSHFGGQMHGFLTASKFVPEAGRAIAEIGDHLRQMLDADRGHAGSNRNPAVTPRPAP
jgi:acetyl esterase